jgi:hypothetical protein
VWKGGVEQANTAIFTGIYSDREGLVMRRGATILAAGLPEM